MQGVLAIRLAHAVAGVAQTEHTLRTLVVGKRVGVRVQQRARIVMLAAKGVQNKDIGL